MILGSTTQWLEVQGETAIGAAASQMVFTGDFHEWLEKDTGHGRPGPFLGNASSTAAVTMLAAPTVANRFRQINRVSVHNPDSATQVAKIQVNDNGTRYIVHVGILAPRKTLFYERGTGWNLL